MVVAVTCVNGLLRMLGGCVVSVLGRLWARYLARTFLGHPWCPSRHLTQMCHLPSASTCVDAVRQEIDSLVSPRPGLAAVAVALAEILDNPKATSSKPPAANQLMRVMELLRKSSEGARRGRLAVVKSMTREQK